jgi:hypothetical protein
MKQIIFILTALFALSLEASAATIFSGPVRNVTAYTAQQDTATLLAPGYFKPISSTGFLWGLFIVKVTNVNTSATFRFWGKALGGLDWFNLDAENDSTVVTANKTIGLVYQFLSPVDSVKIEFHSEAGGTAATPTAMIKLGNPNK